MILVWICVPTEDKSEDTVFAQGHTEHLSGEYKQFSVIAVSLYGFDDLPLFNL